MDEGLLGGDDTLADTWGDDVGGNNDDAGEDGWNDGEQEDEDATTSASFEIEVSNALHKRKPSPSPSPRPTAFTALPCACVVKWSPC